MNFDEILKHPNLCLSYYLMSSFLYYKLQTLVFTDYEYDTLAQALMPHWDEITHPHKNLISIEDLKAGTGYGINWYPRIVEQAAQQWLEESGKRR